MALLNPFSAPAIDWTDYDVSDAGTGSRPRRSSTQLDTALPSSPTTNPFTTTSTSRSSAGIPGLPTSLSSPVNNMMQPPGDEPPDDTPPPAPPPPSSGSGWTVDKVREWMRAHGVAQSIIDQEATNDLLRYGDQLESVLNQSLPNWLARGNSQQGGGGSSSGGGTHPNTSPQFNDPASQLVENFALDWFHQLVNPNAQSGTAMLEQYLRDYFKTLTGDPYSPTQESQIKQSAYNAIEAERTATKQRWMEEVSRRGFAPSSGVALDGLRKIDEHYGQLRAQSDNAYALNAINTTQANRAQAASVLSALASGERGRIAEALQYAMIPLGLQDRSFNQGLALTGQANPATISNSALSILQMLQQANQINGANRAQFAQGLLQYLGYLFG